MLTSPTSPGAPNANGANGAMNPAPVPPGAFRTGDLVEVFTDSVRALARVRESSEAGRLHIAFEMGEYLPWVDTTVLIRRVPAPAPVHADDVATSSNDVDAVPCSCTARILHAGTSTALLQLLHVLEELRTGREPYDTIPSLD